MIEAGLPSLGSWPTSIHGDLGTLNEQGGKVQCHICGNWFGSLWGHLRKHRINSDSYRAYFGLSCTRPLCSQMISKNRSDTSQRLLEQGSLSLPETFPAFTREQRSNWSWNRDQRLENQLKNVVSDPEHQRQAAQARVALYEKYPERKKEWVGKIRAKRPRIRNTDEVCQVCGVPFCPLSYTKRTTCGSPECLKEVRRKAQRASQIAKDLRQRTSNG